MDKNHITKHQSTMIFIPEVSLLSRKQMRHAVLKPELHLGLAGRRLDHDLV